MAEAFSTTLSTIPENNLNCIKSFSHGVKLPLPWYQRPADYIIPEELWSSTATKILLCNCKKPRLQLQ